MSDYIFMLENHLSPDQNRVVADVQAVAGQANVNVFLAGGAMRDMLGGFRIRDLDFSVEGNALKMAKAVAAAGATVVMSNHTEFDRAYDRVRIAQLPRAAGEPHPYETDRATVLRYFDIGADCAEAQRLSMQ